MTPPKRQLLRVVMFLSAEVKGDDLEQAATRRLADGIDCPALDSVTLDSEKFGVWILWGSAPEPGTVPTRYEFDTQAELDAFLKGVDESSGWLEYEQRDNDTPYDPDQNLDDPVDEEHGYVKMTPEQEARYFNEGDAVALEVLGLAGPYELARDANGQAWLRRIDD